MSDKVSNSDLVATEESNTDSVLLPIKDQKGKKLEGKKQGIERKFWAFTMFNFLEIKATIVAYLEKNCVKWTIGIEKCPTTGNEHLQGYFELKKKMRLTSIQNKPVTWSKLAPTYSGEYDNDKYCSKDGNLFSKFPKDKVPVEILLKSELRPFQRDLEKIVLQKADDRKIIWITDEDGQHGKSKFSKYLIHHHGAVYITEGKKNDIINIVYMACLNADPTIILVDIPRCNKNVSYKVLEEIKNGIICNCKYETGCKLINPPHIVVFSNWAPDLTKFTKDRWQLYGISATHELLSVEPDHGPTPASACDRTGAPPPLAHAAESWQGKKDFQKERVVKKPLVIEDESDDESLGGFMRDTERNDYM